MSRATVSAEEGPDDECDTDDDRRCHEPRVGAAGHATALRVESHGPSIATGAVGATDSVETMLRRVLLLVSAGAGLTLGVLPAGLAAQTGDTATTTTSASTSTTSTTSSLPSAVTTVPEGCPGPPAWFAVFVGRLERTEGSAGIYTVLQVRAGALDAAAVGTEVRVSYGTDVRFLETGETYIVGTASDPVTLALASTVRDAPDLFGGAELAGSRETCPSFEQPARTLRLDGTSVDTGILAGLSDARVLLLAVLVVPPVVVVAGLLAAVRWRRGGRR